MTYEVFQRQNQRLGRTQWFWHVRSENGSVLSASEEGYDDVKKCYTGIRRGKGPAVATVQNLVTGESVVVLPMR